jgi:hypothetical protein
MTQKYNTRVLVSGYPTYIGTMPFTQMQRNRVGQKAASTAWRFSDNTDSPLGILEIPDQEVEIEPDGIFAALTSHGAKIVRVCTVDVADGDQQARQLTREELIARIPQEEAELRKNYDDYTDPASFEKKRVVLPPVLGYNERFKRSDL